MYPPSEAYNHGYLTRDGHRIYWEQCGNPIGSPVLIVHGGPGSGAGPWWTQFCDPASCRMILVDQRGCGRSRPHAGDTVGALKDNTTQHLIGDFEALRDVLGIETWVLFGGSWGSTLSLAYAVAHPDRVTALVLWAVVLTRRSDIQWLTSTMGEIYPAEYDDLVTAAGGIAQEENLCLAINRLLRSDDPAVADAAAGAWCRWEDRIATLGGPVQRSARFLDSRFRLGFARIVTHYFGNAAFLPDDAITSSLDRIADIPATFVRGRLDIASPLRPVHELSAALPNAHLHILEDARHGPDQAAAGILLDALWRAAR